MQIPDDSLPVEDVIAKEQDEGRDVAQGVSLLNVIVGSDIQHERLGKFRFCKMALRPGLFESWGQIFLHALDVPASLNSILRAHSLRYDAHISAATRGFENEAHTMFSNLGDNL